MTRTVRHGGRRPVVTVVGDVLLDVDITGRTERICPDAPAPVVDVDGRRESPGGAGLTALLCAASGVDVTLVAPVADDEAGRRLEASLGERVRLLRLGHEGGTRTKTRVRCDGQTLLRLDGGGPGTPVDPPLDRVAAAFDEADVVLVSDYGAGTTRDTALRRLLAERAAAGTLVWDPHPRGGKPVGKSTLVTPNLAEAQAALGDLGRGTPAGSSRDGASPEVLARALLDGWSVRGVCVTAGAAGAYLAMPGGEPLYVPAEEVSGDTCGAGDRLAATAAVCLARGAVLSEAVVEAVAAASSWVAAGGAAGFRSAGGYGGTGATADVRVAVPPGTGAESAAEVLQRVRLGGGRVVATGGCFDVLHAGHVACLQAARRLGDALVVLLNSDESVRRAKGPGRPVVPAHDRAQVLLGLGCVDAVEVFDEDEPNAALDRLRPDVWAKGGDYGGAMLPEAEVVRAFGGRVVLLPYLGGRSTTRILQASRTGQNQLSSSATGE